MNLIDAQQYCAKRAAASGSSFYYSFLFLPPAQRNAITVFYAFCREIDDVVDEIKDENVATAKLAWWSTEVERMFAAKPDTLPSHPISIALQPVVAEFSIKASELQEIITGMRMDLQQHQYADLEALRVYCWRVAGVVGVVAARIFNQGSDACREYATQLGYALQLTNIIRDVGEDAQRGRVYIPQDALRKAGIATHQLTQKTESKHTIVGLEQVLNELAIEAKKHFGTAMKALPTEALRKQRAGLIMGRIYARLLIEIESTGFAVLHQRIALTPLTKFWLAWRTWITPKSAVKAMKTL